MSGTLAPAKPTRVLLWSTQGAGLHYGGPGMTAYRLYSRADEGFFDISLAHASRVQEPYPLFSEIHRIAPRTDSAFAAWRYVQSARHWLKANAKRFDVFHGLRAYHETVLPAFFAQRHGLPAVVKPAAHHADIAIKSTITSWLGFPQQRRKMLSSISGVIAISRAIADELIDHGIPERRIARIPNGVDTQLFLPADEMTRRQQRLSLGWRDLPTLLFVGAILPRKRPHLLVEAVALARDQGQECQVVLAGPVDHDPNYVGRIRERADELGCKDLLVMTGFCRDIAPLYRAADFFGFPSEREGLPNALLEAMASGLPVIFTPFAGYEDLLGAEPQGHVVKDDPGEIAEALVSYLKAPSLARQHGAAGRARAHAHFGTKAVLNAHDRLFRRILAGGDAAE